MKNLKPIKIKSIKKIEKEPVYCIEVKDNHNFFMQSDILTKNCIIIADECQNISIPNMKSLMTRIGQNSKLILTGDTKQTDLKNKKKSSLALIEDKFDSIDDVGIIKFEKGDQVRNPFINQIEDIFDKIEEEL